MRMKDKAPLPREALMVTDSCCLEYVCLEGGTFFCPIGALWVFGQQVCIELRLPHPQTSTVPYPRLALCTHQLSSMTWPIF